VALEDLNQRQRRFVEAYLGPANGNAAEAARIVGLSTPASAGPRMCRIVQVRAAIAARTAEAAMAANEVLARLSDHAAADIDDFLTIGRDKGPDGYRIDLEKAKKRGKLHLIKKLVPTKYGLGIELCDSQAALMKLGQYHGLFDRIDMENVSDQDLRKHAGRPDPSGDPQEGSAGPDAQG
jgi:Terminase small subunit